MRIRISLAAALALGVALSAPAARGEDPFLRRSAAVRVVEKTRSAVVNITAQQLAQGQRFSADPFFDRFFRDFF